MEHHDFRVITASVMRPGYAYKIWHPRRERVPAFGLVVFSLLPISDPQMKQVGILSTWDDVRGFGFIEPALGGPQVFVHIKAFERLAGRLVLGARLSFEVEMTHDGKKRAARVQLLKTAQRRVPRQDDVPAQWGTASYLVMLLLGALYLALGALWRVPVWVAGWYVLTSVITLVAYGVDKSAARAGRRRIREDTLHGLALLGGWPGALLAQQLLRHKSNKAAFRAVFWLTVGANLLVFVLLGSPYLPKLW